MTTEQISQQISIPDFARVPQEVATQYPLYTDSPRQYGFNGATGKFNCGSEEFDSLWVQPIDWQWKKGERWGRAGQNWLEFAFVDPDHIVGAIALKKDSAVNVQAFFQRLVAGKVFDGVGIQPTALWIHLTPQKKEIETTVEGYLEHYFVVQVSQHSFASQEQFEAVCLFAQSELLEFQWTGEVED